MKRTISNLHDSVDTEKWKTDQDSLNTLEKMAFQVAFRTLTLYEEKYGELPSHNRVLDFVTEKLVPSPQVLCENLDLDTKCDFNSEHAVSTYVYFGMRSAVETAVCAATEPMISGRYDIYIQAGINNLSVGKILPSFSLSQHGQKTTT